jgi:pSer/pThr/pTyr-binding forkhead associated (FHA) protein
MATNFRLVIRSGVDVGKEFILDKNELIIGREQTADITISDPEISRRHARLFFQNGGYIIEDLGSTNGTFVNGQKISGPYLLRPGEVVNFGEHVSVLFESVQVDPNATVVSSAAALKSPISAAPGKTPLYTPPPAQAVPQSAAPVYQQSSSQSQAPQPFSAPIPQAQPAKKPEKASGTTKMPPWLKILIIVALAILVLCICPIVLIDSLNMWCKLFGGIFNSINPGVCF